MTHTDLLKRIHALHDTVEDYITYDDGMPLPHGSRINAKRADSLRVCMVDIRADLRLLYAELGGAPDET